MVEIIRSISRFYNKYFRSKPVVQRGFVLLLSFIIIWTALSFSLIPRKLEAHVGGLSTTAVYAPFEIENKAATAQAIEQAVANVPGAYVRDRSHEETVYDNLEALLVFINTLEKVSFEDMRHELAEVGDGTLEQRSTFLSDSTLRNIQAMDEEALANTLSVAKQILEKVYDDGISSIERGREVLLVELEEYKLKKEIEKTVIEILYTVYTPSYNYSEALTNRIKEDVRRSVEPVMIKKDEVLLYEGKIITAETMEMLERTGFIPGPRRQQMFLGLTAFVFVAFVIIGFLLHGLTQRHIADVEKFTLFYVVLTVGVAASVLLAGLSPYLTAGVMIAVVLTVLLDWKIAAIGLLSHNFLIMPLFGQQILVTIGLTVAGFVAIAASERMSQRTDIVRIALTSATSLGLILLSVYIYRGALDPTYVALYDIISATLSTVTLIIIAIGSLPLLENLFDITSSVRLMELSNPNQVLLRRLQTEAPGTYNHSLIVANLSEIAAEEIGANSLLARVGAYYHDIGKLQRPQFFVENQLGQGNPHEQYNAELSALIISSHIKDGVELARQHKLPKVIIDILEQHHGTSVVTYFYHKAMEADTDTDIRKADYQYDGPKPQSKEAAIVMLADTVEAAVRSMDRKTPGKISELVEKLCRAKLDDGQLNEADLTMKELDTIIKTFNNSLTGIYHERIAYPEKSIADLERSRRLGRHSSD